MLGVGVPPKIHPYTAWYLERLGKSTSGRPVLSAAKRGSPRERTIRLVDGAWAVRQTQQERNNAESILRWQESHYWRTKSDE